MDDATKEAQAEAVLMFAFWLYLIGKLSLRDSTELSAEFRAYNSMGITVEGKDAILFERFENVLGNCRLPRVTTEELAKKLDEMVPTITGSSVSPILE